jgi:hypothetical protein
LGCFGGFYERFDVGPKGISVHVMIFGKK